MVEKVTFLYHLAQSFVDNNQFVHKGEEKKACTV